jgi:LysR family nitrogen assimilation transcriptional regulator
MAVLYNTPHSPEIETRILHRETLVLIASEASVKRMQGLTLQPEMPLSVLANLPLIVPSRPNAFRIIIDTELDHLRCKPQIVLEVDGLNAILELVGEGLGFAVLPPYTLSNFQKPHTFATHKLHTPQLVCELMLVTSARRPSTETHKGVQALVADVVKNAIEGYS